ncbi:hypothetical protein FRC12_024483 [Ceratobasidium sp. 428]|nr:hypothetical protein FRC12_024483 [Ceratobasidium sp. 428]
MRFDLTHRIESTSVSQDDLSLLALYPRGKRMRRAGAFMVKGKTVEEERTVIKHLKQTSASDDCGQPSNPTTVTRSTTYTINNKRKATLQTLPNGVRKKQKRSDSTPVAGLQVKQATENTMNLLPTFAPVLNIPGNCSQKSRSDPQRYHPQRRTSKSNPWRRSSLPTILEPFHLALGSEKLEHHDEEQPFTPHGGFIFQEPDEMDYEQEYHATIEQAGTGVIKRATIQYQVKTEQRVHDSKQEGSSISPTEVLDGRRRALVVS